ncbi:TIGR03757 family integrating conjugative element protein [Salmonella enterica subsp. enterica]|nr:TIGR03757 family integrating conjugative element protein [Salmonella enterica]EKT1334694.1 TIGR03757 family integrating conjugative element protein [Salmonella enterica]
MRLRIFFALATVFSSSGGLAQTVIYTTPIWPVADPQPGVLVQILENIHQLEQSLFPQLPDNPALAEQQARIQMQQQGWREQEAHLTRAYQALLEARTVGIEKVPAVVFDDKYVVYGTTDAALAQQKLDSWREQRP